MNTAAEIAIDVSGRFLYASNRGDDSIAVFRVEPNTGKLDKLSVTPAGIKGPRNTVPGYGPRCLLRPSSGQRPTA